MKRSDFRSTFEWKVAQYLTNRKVMWEYETLKLEYFRKVKGGMCNDCESTNIIVPSWYTPDFFLPELDIIIECKGKWVSSDRTKMLSVLEAHQDSLDIRMLFQRDNWVTKKHKNRYSDICKKHGITYTVEPNGKVPLNWLR